MQEQECATNEEEKALEAALTAQREAVAFTSRISSCINILSECKVWVAPRRRTTPFSDYAGPSSVRCPQTTFTVHVIQGVARARTRAFVNFLIFFKNSLWSSCCGIPIWHAA